MITDHAKGLVRAYQGAGSNFLAYRLGRLFIKIEDQRDTILHNDILAEVLEMISGNEKEFFKDVADKILMYGNKNK